MRCLCLLLILSLAASRTGWSQAFPINSDVAIQPAQNQLIYRTQLRYRTSEIKASNTELDFWSQSNIFVYGWTSRISTVVALPLVYRDLDSPITRSEEFGVGDIRVLLRYQLWKKLGYLSSKSWTILGGIEIPTNDGLFSSRSWDPIIGTVYSWRKERHGFDLDLILQVNTENDREFKAGNVLRYDLVYQFRLFPIKFVRDTKWSLTGLLELNGNFHWEKEVNGRKVEATDASDLSLSPGLVLAGRRTKYEAGLQFPIYQDIENTLPKDSIRVVVGFTMSF